MTSRRPSSARLSRPEPERSVLQRAPSFKTIGRFAGYTPLASLGSCGEAELYVGERSPIGSQHVLLKHVSRGRRGYLAIRERMIEEGRYAYKVAHPAFLPLLNADEDDSGFTLAYDSPSGIELSRVIRTLADRGEALPFELVAHSVRELAQPTVFAHREGVVLRDILAENVVVTPRGRLLIATHRLELGHPDREPVWEESAHLAPECLSRCEYGIASDIYALGVLLFTLLRGHSPPAGSAVPLEQLVAEGIPGSLIAVVARATHPAKSRRYQEALDLAAELESWLASQHARVTPAVMAAFFERHRLG